MAAAVVSFAGGNVAPILVAEEPSTGNFYVGTGYSYLDTDLTAVGVTANMTNNAVSLQAGYNFNEYVAVEGRYAFVGGGDVQIAGTNVVEMDGGLWSLFVKPQYPVSQDFKVYGLLGYGETMFASTTGNNVVVDNAGGFQYGVGAAYAVVDAVDVFVDWVRPLDETIEGLADTTDVYTVGLTYNF